MTDNEYRQHLLVMALAEVCFNNLNSGSSDELEDILDKIDSEVNERLMAKHGLDSDEAGFGEALDFTDKIVDDLFHILKIKAAEIGVITHDEARRDY